MRSMLGVAWTPQGYSCPNRGCGSPDVLALGVITRPQPGEPWKQQRVGTLVQCVKCAERYCVTLDGIYSPTEGHQEQRRRVFPDDAAPASPGMIDALLEDMRRPSEGA